MSGLPAPVKDLLRDPLGEEAVQRVWRRIGEQRARSSRAAWRPVGLGVAFATVVIALALLWVDVRSGGQQAPAAGGALLLAGGGAVPSLEARASAPAPPPVLLSDGSTLTLTPGARLDPLENSAGSFSLLLAAGRVDFAVHKGGSRRWAIECGLATVEVIGTHFAIERSDARVRIEVMEGVVLVRGERLPDRVRRLVAGESLDVQATRGEIDGDALRGTPAPAAQPTAAVSAIPQLRSTPAPPAWHELARQGRYEHAYDALGPGGVAGVIQGRSVDDLLTLADIARLSDHPTEAIAPLSTLVRDHPGDKRAALAAFTLGRIQLDTLGQPGAAAGAFTDAIALGLSSSLVEDARARIVEARARAGDVAGARVAAEEYERQFPNGRHLAVVRRWVHGE